MTRDQESKANLGMFNSNIFFSPPTAKAKPGTEFGFQNGYQADFTFLFKCNFQPISEYFGVDRLNFKLLSFEKRESISKSIIDVKTC